MSCETAIPTPPIISTFLLPHRSRYISGPAHAKYFIDVVEKDGQGPALGTVLRGKGYVAFEEENLATLPVALVAELVEEDYGSPGTMDDVSRCLEI